MRRPILDLFWTLLHKRTMLVLGVVAAIAAAIVVLQMFRVSRNLLTATALQDAALYSEAIAEFRTLYSREVVETVRSQGIEVTHDFREKEGAIPLPATFSMLLGKRIGEHESGAKTRLYSDYPFPYAGRDGLRDEFGRRAWQTFQNNPEEPVYDFVELDGRPVVRYATADLMRPSCVNCHNTHPDSPKNDWKEGDVRGVLEVILPMDHVESQIRAGLRETLILMTVMTVAGLGGLALVTGRLRRTSTELEQRVAEVHARERQIHRANEELAELNSSLEQRVAERTAEADQRAVELARSIEELERFNRLTVGREQRVIELKRRVNELSQELGHAAPYNVSFEEA